MFIELKLIEGKLILIDVDRIVAIEQQIKGSDVVMEDSHIYYVSEELKDIAKLLVE